MTERVPELMPVGLSPVALQLLEMGGDGAYSRLVVRGGGSGEARSLLQKLRPPDLFEVPVIHPDSASAALAGLWLWHDWLDDSHTLSQSIASPLGSYWHAIMHRREGDFSNAKYWYARCANHPARARIADLVSAMPQVAADHTASRILKRNGWDSNALVDLAEEAEGRPANDKTRAAAVALQKLEWRALFHETVRAATGGSNINESN